MAIDERARHRLFQKLEQVLEPEEAAILMEHLPPVGWPDVATKRDLDMLGERLELQLAALEGKMTAAWRADLAAQARHQTTVMLGMNSGLAVVFGLLAFSAAKLV
jgi:hypothetical protein